MLEIAVEGDVKANSPFSSRSGGDKLKRAVSLHKGGHTRKAARLYDDILKRDSSNVIAHQLRAQIHYRAGQNDEAVRHLTEALQWVDTRASVWLDLGNAYHRLHRKQEALDSYEACLAIEPNNFRALNNCAAILKELGRLEEAIERYDRAATLAPNDPTILLNLGHSYRKAQRLGDAVITYRRALSLQPEDIQTLLSLGLILLDQKNIVEAHAFFNKVLSIDPNQVEALRGLSVVLDFLGQTSQAIAATRRAAQFKTPTIISCTGDSLGRVLVLSCVDNRMFRINDDWRIGSPADNNLKEYIDLRKFDAVELLVEHYENDRSVLGRLPPALVVLNTIAEADDKSRALSLADEIIGQLGLPAINIPSATLAATRDQNYSALSRVPGFIFPKTSRIRTRDRLASAVWEQLTASGHEFPVIIREPGSHLGTTMALIQNYGELEAFLSNNVVDELYVIRFYESPCPYGFHRRFRVFFLDGKPCPANCYFGTGWNVHRKESDELASANKQLQILEERFLQDPAAEIGSQNYERLKTLPEIIELDYFGVDFNVTRDGSLLIYEANAAMAHRRNREIDYPYLTPHFENFKEGFEALLLRKISGR